MRRLQLDRYSLLVVVVIGAATLARVVLIALGPSYFDSDEGTTGLMALHIAHDGAHPAFFYGQSYMGALEAYLAVPTIRLFGVSVFGLRLGLVPLFVLFVITECLLVKQLYNRRTALLLLPLLSLGSQEVWSRQLKATSGYPEMLFLGCAVLLVAAWLGTWGAHHPLLRRLLAYGAWGVIAGLPSGAIRWFSPSSPLPPCICGTPAGRTCVLL